jgi:hypothetical protein
MKHGAETVYLYCTATFVTFPIAGQKEYEDCPAVPNSGTVTLIQSGGSGPWTLKYRTVEGYDAYSALNLTDAPSRPAQAKPDYDGLAKCINGVHDGNYDRCKLTTLPPATEEPPHMAHDAAQVQQQKPCTPRNEYDEYGPRAAGSIPICPEAKPSAGTPAAKPAPPVGFYPVPKGGFAKGFCPINPTESEKRLCNEYLTVVAEIMPAFTADAKRRHLEAVSQVSEKTAVAHGKLPNELGSIASSKSNEDKHLSEAVVQAIESIAPGQTNKAYVQAALKEGAAMWRAGRCSDARNLDNQGPVLHTSWG